ncbi:DUF551 domain-containing protein [Enterobacter hormaechei subsp. xiangfangensis]|uniref:DUF551 domain-containing protein n=1 Tax=Enterobacter hormaechei TaxID=158836 RepID=UPI003F4248B3
MSTITKEFTKEQLQQIIETDHVQCGEASSLARIALASIEAEPVAWLLSGGGAKNDVRFDSRNAYADPLREVTPLYTATPAPISVPDAMEMDDDFDSAFEHGKAVGWNAYRAAMLQGAEPAKGWIPCSERMPEEIGRYWCYVEEQNCLGKSHYQWNCSWNGDRWWVESENGGRVTHWMPLPNQPKE